MPTNPRRTPVPSPRKYRLSHFLSENGSEAGGKELLWRDLEKGYRIRNPDWIPGVTTHNEAIITLLKAKNTVTSWVCQCIRTLQYGYEEQKCNHKKPAVYSHGTYNPKALWWPWHRGPSSSHSRAGTHLAPPPQNRSKSKIPTQKQGTLSRGEHTHALVGPWAASGLAMPQQMPNVPPRLGQEGFWGRGAMPPSPVPSDGHRAELATPPGAQPSARGGCLGMPWENPCGDIIANQANQRVFSHHLCLGLSDV